MNKDLLIELTKRDFVDRYNGSILGLLWAFIWPIVNMLVYIVVFSKIMGAKLPGNSPLHGYGIYLIAGLTPWIAFTNTIARTSTLFVDKKHLITKIRLSLPTLPLTVVLSETITFIITMGFYIGFLLITGSPIYKTIILLPFIYMAQQILAYSLGFLVAILHVFIRDLKEVVGITIFVWFWANPIVYVKDILPEFMQKLLVFNPTYWFIDAYQAIFIFNRMPDFNLLFYLVFLGHFILLLSYILFKKLEKDVRDFL
jgi:lipopolysaccharide transport system permease protein